MHGTGRGRTPDTWSSASVGPAAPHGLAPPRPAIRFLTDVPPIGADTIEVAPGILWARIPLPFRLNHVNVWLVRERDGWTLIDTGTSDPAAKSVWERLMAGVLSGAPISRLIATHGHTDHVGLAGWLQEQADGAPYHIALAEWLSAQLRIEEARSPLSRTALQFLENHGCDRATIDGFADDRRRTHAFMQPLPPAIHRLRDRASITFGGRQWQIMLCGGHAAEQTSFWCAAERILIAGDQILSKISPMIGVFPAEPDANPLAEYLLSLDRFRALGSDILVLPSHGLPFWGLTDRANELDEHHQIRLEHLHQLMQEPTCAMDLARGLFQKAVAEGQARHAFAETLAHAHYLVGIGRAHRIVGRDRRITFVRTA